MTSPDKDIELSVVMPCLNESETLAICIKKAAGSIKRLNINAEIIIADNGSNDGSQKIAEELGARVVQVREKGYGNALMGGIRAALGKFVIMGDADDSYDFNSLDPFIHKLREGYELVMGNRFKGGIKKGAMPPLHKYLGNPVLTTIGKILFKSPIGDFHCGLRGFSREAIMKLNLRTTGMEFASEMVVKATLYKLKTAEVPTTLSPDGRSGSPHLRSWRDGWRHLRFMLLYSPKWLFFYPGTLLMLAGITLAVWVIPGPKTIGKITFDVHTLLFAVMAIISGYQAIIFAMLTKIFASVEGLIPEDPGFNKIFQYITLETGLVLGALLMLIGGAGNIYLLLLWGEKSFGSLDPVKTMRIIIPSFTLFTLGFQTILSSFFFSILGMGRAATVSSENQAPGEMLKKLSELNKNPFISIVIPVFNEEKRIETFLSTVINYLHEKDFSYEIIIVDDGSIDQTVSIIDSMFKKNMADKYRIIKLDPNIGKGGAVRRGMMEATGEYVFFIDADGATPINEIDNFIENFNPQYDVYTGKRAVKESTPFKRIFLGYGYTILANSVLGLKIFDYTCGFKCYSRRSIKKIFPRQTLNNWSFDTEDLFIASKYSFKILAIPVKWQHIEGSKVKVLQNVFICALDLLKIRINNMKGLYL